MFEGQTTDADVVVVGAGPTGLMLATELRLRGVATIVVDRLTQRSEFGKALNIQPRTAEVCATVPHDDLTTALSAWFGAPDATA